MGDWQLLDDSHKSVTTAHDAYKLLSHSNLDELKKQTPSSLPFGCPQTQTVFLSMLAIKQWLGIANVEIYCKGLDKIRKVPGHRNVIAPNHPNLFDSIVTRFVLYVTKQVVPFTAAINTLAKVPLVNKLLKDNGTFFIDVKRFGDLDYREQVNSFMRNVTDSGEWLCFYPEGDRTAHERQRILRHGLLSAMVDKPCAFTPVSISYEKIPHSYVSSIGRVYVEFHDPILHDSLDYLPDLVSKLSEDLQMGVNAYTTDLVATILLNRSVGETLSLEELEAEVDWLRAVLVSREVPYVEVPLEKALHFLNVKVQESSVTVPEEQSWLLSHRERILHALYDLADPPPFLVSEFAWTPPASLILDERLRDLASKAISPLVMMYSAIITLLDQGVNDVSVIEKAVVTPQITIQAVRNTFRILQAQEIVAVKDGLVSLN
jgi:1-acyl-sn-glycerol-3-phosphate acyltransferase